MENMLQNTDCVLCGTPHCALLNQKSCDKCFVSKLSREDQIKAGEDIFYIADVLPEKGAEDIMNSENCALCRTHAGEGEEEAEKATRYAQIDMGHVHPLVAPEEKETGKYRRAASMVIPVQLPVCDECRHRLNMLYYLPLGLGVIVALIGLIVTSIEPVRVPLTRYGRILPFLVFLIFVCLAVIVYAIAQRALRVRVERSMNTRAKRIPALAELVKNGWFPIGDKNGMLPFTFTTQKLDNGLLTGENQEELLRNIREYGKESIELIAKKKEKDAEE